MLVDMSDVRFGSSLCENSDVELARRKFVSITLNNKRTALAVTVERRKERKQFCAFSARARFHTAWVMNGPDALEMRCPLLSRKQTFIGRRRKVGFLDLIPKSLRTNQAHRSASSSRQRIDHPHPQGRTGSLGSFGSCPLVPQPRGHSSGQR